MFEGIDPYVTTWSDESVNMFSKHGGGLYGDLPKAKGDTANDLSENQNDTDEGKKSRWGSSVMRKGGLDPALAPVAVKRRPQPAAKPPSVAKSKVARGSVGELSHMSLPKGHTVLSSDPIESPGGLTFNTTTVQDPYDPLVPNNYEKILEEKEQMRLLEDKEIERLELERLVKKKQKTAEQEQVAAEPVPEKGMTLAQKMLEKMGWKKGQGLGKNKQGISEALKVEKTDVKSGRIVEPSPVEKQSPPPDTRGPPSKVIILTNVVGPGEVDEALDDEIGTECSKHGQVSSVLIFEVTDPSYPPEGAVRIFVEFEEQEAATKAIEELHGRFFGGRAVQADYYDQKRFDDNDLAPSL